LAIKPLFLSHSFILEHRAWRVVVQTAWLKGARGGSSLIPTFFICAWEREGRKDGGERGRVVEIQCFESGQGGGEGGREGGRENEPCFLARASR